jgi:hypothetical protein
MNTWDENKARLREIKSLSEEWEQGISDILQSPMLMCQFDRDMKMYGLWEAVRLVREESMQIELEELLLGRLHADQKKKIDPSTYERREWHTMERPGKIVEDDSRKPFPPDVSWRIRKDMIRERCLALMNTAEGKKSRLESILSSAIPHADIVDHAMKLSRISFCEAIETLPMSHRLVVMSRIMRSLDIPEPIQPKTGTNGNRHIPNPDLDDRQPTYLLDHKGNAWTWNCGWRRIGDDGQPVDNKPPLGHTKFRRAITLATPEQLGLTSFHRTRPHGQWRHATKYINHKLWGNGELEHTDGIHAIIKFSDGIRREVMLANTQQIAVPTAKKPQAVRAATPRESKQSKKLEEILSIIDSIL